MQSSTPATSFSHSLRALAIATGLACLLPLVSSPALAESVPPVSLEAAVEAASDVPAELQQALDTLLEAANNRDLERVMSLYSPNFTHGDGLTLEAIETVLTNFWDTHPGLTYAATISDWKAVDDGIEATIVTVLRGTQASERGDFHLQGSNTVRNFFQPDPDQPDRLLLVKQDVLAESTTLTAGDAPPHATLNIPAKVSVGSVFDVEAIIEEPLGDSLMLGAALEEPITPETYLDSPPLPLQPLQAGGIFRRADAPIRPGSKWISVMLVGDGGILIEGRRLDIVIGPVD
ncbi:hypothetical protein [Synechococcus sp. PCC 7336]|uniref:hypothetical protein n=1 Tax=Synechococcus sp. PCC 7336 TaxID=195250 RepID=UPI00034684CD|nr:hypothetical protein [Synechococcus sp. PCC 7336]